MTATSQRATSILPLRYWYASLIRDQIKDAKLKQRMSLALATIRATVMQERAENDMPVLHTDDPAREGRQVVSGLEKATQGVAVIVELWSLNPFHPHVINYGDLEAKTAMAILVRQAGIPVVVGDLERLWNEAERAFRPTNHGQLIKRVTGGLLVAVLIATVVPTWGASAPAVTATLAALGFGSVAAGGLGMAGGMTALWLGGMAGGGLLTHTAQILQHIGAEGLRLELTKFEVTQKLWWGDSKPGPRTPGVPRRVTVIREQKQLLEKLNELLTQEQVISDPNSPPIKELTEMVRLSKVSVERFEAQR